MRALISHLATCPIVVFPLLLINVDYSITVQIGDKGKSFQLLLDSGSSDFWVSSGNCTSCAGANCTPCRGTTLSPSDSSTLKGTGKNWTHGYEAGVVDGLIVNDTAKIGDLNVTAMQIGVAVRDDANVVRILRYLY